MPLKSGRSERGLTVLFVAGPDSFVHLGEEDLPVADLARLGRLDDGLHRRFD